MQQFQELDDYLNQDYSINYWSDDAIFYAQELLQNFAPSDWDNLLNYWRYRPSQWQIYCAEILPWGDTDKAVPLLIKMIQTLEDEVVTAAADSLRDIHRNIIPVHIEPDTRERLQEVAKNNPGLKAQVVDRLLQET